MRYPSFLKQGDTIGLLAPSFGVNSYPYNERYKSAKAKFLALGYKIKECPSLFSYLDGASNTAQQRAKEFMDMYLDDEVDFLYSVGGGEIMMEILPYLDFEKLRQGKPKYFQGYSDNTNVTFLMNTLLDTASIYGICFPTFGMQDWHESVKEALEVAQGKRLVQKTYDKHVTQFLPCELGHALDTYQCDGETIVLGSDCQMEGRLIGGCLDVLDLLMGTPFDHVKEFNERYKDEGIILFLESCDLNVMSQYRSYWKLKQCGWMDYVKGIIVGRSLNAEECFDISVLKALEKQFGEYNIPIVYGVDIGHIPPIWNIISGSYARIEKKGNNCTIEYILK